MLKKSLFYLAFMLMFIFQACNNDPVEEKTRKTRVKHTVTGVSVWDRISAREKPDRDAPRASLLSLGESFLFLDSVAIDSSSNNTKFLKVRLSDSTVVWVYDFASVLNAKPAAITSDVPFYLRPDLLTISDKRMKCMDIVAVLEEWDDWIKVVNEKKENTGWIKKDFLSYDPIDLAFALLVKRALEAESPQEKIEKLEELLENNPYPSTQFISPVKSLIDQEKEKLRDEDDNRDWSEFYRRDRRP